MDAYIGGSGRLIRTGVAVVAALAGLSACADTGHSSPTALEQRGPSNTSATGSACPTYAVPSSCPPGWFAGTRTVSGVLTELTASGRRPLAGAQVWLWIQLDTEGWRFAPAVTDSSGFYYFLGVPDGSVGLEAFTVRFDQPCAAVATTHSVNTTLNIDVVSRASPLPALASGSPTLTGTVYETTASGRLPVAGAVVSYTWWWEAGTATTSTDAAGRYALCNLPFGTNQDLYVDKDGYDMIDQVITLSGSSVLDLELKRY